MAAWPGSLPQYHEINAQDSRQSGFVRTATDTGPFKQRKRYTATVRFLSGTMFFDATQRATFETFYQTTINNGTDAFDFLDPIDGSTVSVRFTQPPVFTGVAGVTGGSLWRGQISLEVLP